MSKENFGNALIAALLSSFEYAYARHSRGESLESIMIDHDIVSAGSDIQEPIVKLHRKAIRSACQAFDAGVAMAEGKAFLYKRMKAMVAEHIAKEDENTKP
jgi:hypothetical protein